MMDATTRQDTGRRRLRRLVAASLVASGCLIPQDDTLLDAVPDFMNRPPRIIESLVAPQQRFIPDFGASTCDLTFEVAVEDPDVDDRIVVHWYVDYNPQDPRGPYRQYELASTREPRRSDRGTLLISLASANNPLAAPGPHLVEALVSDAELVDRVVQPRPVQLPDGTTLDNPGFAVTYSWVVNTVQGDCR
ncbi:hypothetical protein [Corallococcus macrosporus]|uniref:Lipoprotein n=2 Tax=Myxococcaceae TaxID=31 RepID=A0A250JWT3_9BACT|nr:hypothetical protein [Corallococcus macrosporus]AEI67532.1 putative lipoprotein [Corallococcus macrosporus]ATB48305.1 hypothetical protein MYMAC_003931 [Corallococcus macrosporus DSM 14697]